MSFITRFQSVIFLSFICVASVSAAIITPALPLIQKTFLVDQSALNQLVAIFLLGYVIGQLIYGPLSSRTGVVQALRIGLLINIIGILLCLVFSVLVPIFQALLIARLITGLGAASGLCCSIMLIQQRYDEKSASQILSFAIVAFTIGIGSAVTLGGIISEHGGWQGCFWALLGHGILMLSASLFIEKDKPSTSIFSIRPLLTQYLSVLSSARFITYGLSIGIISLVSYGYSASAPYYAHDILHLSTSEYGYWNLMNMLGMIGSGFLSAWLLKSHSPNTVITYGFFMLFILSIAILSIAESHVASPLLFFSVTTALYLVSGSLFSSTTSLATAATQDKTTGASMASFINMGSATMGVSLMGHFSSNALLNYGLILLILLAIVSTMMWGLSLKHNAAIQNEK